MKGTILGCAGAAVLFLVLIVFGLAMDWVVEGNQFLLYRFFVPKQEGVRREVFEQTKSYNEGMKQELQNMMYEHARTPDKNAKAAMASVILHRVSEIDEDKLPSDLRAFVSDLRRQQLERP